MSVLINSVLLLTDSVPITGIFCLIGLIIVPTVVIYLAVRWSRPKPDPWAERDWEIQKELYTEVFKEVAPDYMFYPQDSR